MQQPPLVARFQARPRRADGRQAIAAVWPGAEAPSCQRASAPARRHRALPSYPSASPHTRCPSVLHLVPPWRPSAPPGEWAVAAALRLCALPPPSQHPQFTPAAKRGRNGGAGLEAWGVLRCGAQHGPTTRRADTCPSCAQLCGSHTSSRPLPFIFATLDAPDGAAARAWGRRTGGQTTMTPPAYWRLHGGRAGAQREETKAQMPLRKCPFTPGPQQRAALQALQHCVLPHPHRAACISTSMGGPARVE